MQSTRELLAGLTAIANQAVLVAFIWHAILLVGLLALSEGWRPSRRVARTLIAIPLTSVAAFAFALHNPFNGVVFTASAIALAALPGGDDQVDVSRGPAWQWWTGIAVLVFGWVYPHFLDAGPVAHLYAAPVGLVACPTLSVAIGLALLGGLGTRSWGIALSVLGLFYGLFGTLWLGVHLDIVLVAGSIVLAVATIASFVDVCTERYGA